MFIEQSFNRHNHAGGAEAALKGLVFQKGLLHRIELAVLRETFDREDIFAFDVAGECEAGTHGFSIDEHGAGAADANTAAFNGAFELEFVVQEFQKGLVGIDLNLLLLAVYRRRDRKLHCSEGFIPEILSSGAQE